MWLAWYRLHSHCWWCICIFVCTVWVVGVVVAGGSYKRRWASIGVVVAGDSFKCPRATVGTLGSAAACCTLGIAVLISDTPGSVGIVPLAPVVSINR
jgi:hypothetical protein